MSVSNEEYYQRWEDAAPTPVDSMTPEEIRTAQSRPLQDKPWETYDDEMLGDLADDTALNQAISEYASRVHDAAPTQQTQEELCRLSENNAATAQEYQWVTPEEYANEGDRVGIPMHMCQFISLLQETGINCWYRRHLQPGKTTLIIQRKTLPPEVGCWVQSGWSPELSVMRFDEHGIPTYEKFRGWRTALLQIILKGIISEEKAIEVFGKPPVTKAFHRYNSTLQQFRNAGSRLSK